MGTSQFLRSLQKRVVLPILHWSSPKIALFVTHSIAKLLPQSEWYAATFRVTRLLTAITGPFAGSGPFRADWMLHFWLKHLFSSGRRFPLPIRTVGEEAVLKARTHPKGVVLLSVRLPLAHLILRALVELGCIPNAILVSEQALVNGKFRVAGTDKRLTGIATGSGMVLVKTRSALRGGGMVGALCDTQQCTPVNVNMLRLVGSVQARLVFGFAEVCANGEILIHFYTPPDPFCESPDGIMANIEFLKAKVLELSTNRA